MNDASLTQKEIQSSLVDALGSSWALELIYREMKPEGMASVWQATSQNGRILAVKQAQDTFQTEVQFNALKKLAHTHANCARPLFLDKEHSFFVMEWVSAPTLRERMQDDDRLDLIKQAGRWLAGLHRQTRSRRPYYDRSFENGLLTEGSQTLMAVNDELTRRRKRLWFRASRESLLHTDFQPNNLFVDGQRIIAFDPALHRRGNRYFDVAHFILGMRIARLRASEFQTEWPDSEQADTTAFLSGYGRIPRHRKAMFDFAYDLKLARMWRRRFAELHPTPLKQAEFEMLTRDMQVRQLLA